jgi:sortase B
LFLLIDRYSAGPTEIPEEVAPVVVAPQPEEPAAEPKPEPEPKPPDNGIRPPDRDIDFDALLEINEDTVAWVSVPGTLIDYPVVVSMDNYDYLERGFDGKKNWYGTPFMDMGNSSDFTDRNTVIYGHNVKDEFYQRYLVQGLLKKRPASS